MLKPILSTVTLTAFSVMWIAASAFAQGTKIDPAAQGQPGPAASSAPETDEIHAPVLRIISVEVIRSTHGGTLDIIRVRGLVSSEGWEEAELVPLTRGVPADGMLELAFMAKAPSQPMEAKGFESVEAIFALERNHPYKGVTVRGAVEGVSLTQLPGFVDGKPVGEDCHQCVGKYFVAKGTSAPAGKAAADIVKEDQLPAGTHIIKSSDGLGKIDSDPNRLTLIVSSDGKIANAVWD